MIMAHFSGTVLGSGNKLNVKTGGGRRVIVTPLTPASVPGHLSSSSASSNLSEDDYSVIDKLLIKVCAKGSEKEFKTFTLRNIDTGNVNTCDRLKLLISAQLDSDVTRDFDVGFVKSGSLVSIRSSSDLLKAWQAIYKGSNVILWCDGLKEPRQSMRKRAHASIDTDDESDEKPSRKRGKKTIKKSAKPRLIK